VHQFTAYQNANPRTKKLYPYLVDVQSELLEGLHTTVVIPLCPGSEIADKAITKLCPIVQVKGQNYVVLTQQIAGINRNQLGKRVTDLSEYRTLFIAAIDFLITGI
jgi:toxin CcdB